MRRATSPSINTDKSLKEARAPAASVDQRPAVLAAHRENGVSKKHKRKSVLSTKARQRREKAMEMAEAVAERTAVKVQKSKNAAKVIDSRKKTWDQINKEVLLREEAERKAREEAAGSDDDDMDEDEAEMEDAPAPSPAKAESKSAAPVEQDMILLEEEEEEVL